MKMYILVRESLPLGFAMVGVAHATLARYLKFSDHSDTRNWLDSSFRKAICRVNDAEFEKAKNFSDFVLITESSLNHQEVALAFRPRKDWPKTFRYYSLYDDH